MAYRVLIQIPVLCIVLKSTKVKMEILSVPMCIQVINPMEASNYVSLTVWDEKSDFSARRKGDAFKEAHGGMSILVHS